MTSDCLVMNDKGLGAAAEPAPTRRPCWSRKRICLASCCCTALIATLITLVLFREVLWPPDNSRFYYLRPPLTPPSPAFPPPSSPAPSFPPALPDLWPQRPPPPPSPPPPPVAPPLAPPRLISSAGFALGGCYKWRNLGWINPSFSLAARFLSLEQGVARGAIIDGRVDGQALATRQVAFRDEGTKWVLSGAVCLEDRSCFTDVWIRDDDGEICIRQGPLTECTGKSGDSVRKVSCLVLSSRD